MILVNGKQSSTLPVTDRGLQYGDGVWETILIKQGKAILLEEHLNRLQFGLNRLRINHLNIKDLHEDLEKILQVAENNILKIIVTRGSGGRGYNPAGLDQATRILSLHPIPRFPETYTTLGINLTLCKMRLAHNPILAGFKHLNRLEQVMARGEFTEPYQEGLLMDYTNDIIEGTMSNIFIIKDNNLTTPKLDNCGIRGVMQMQVIKILNNHGYAVEKKNNISVQDVQNADGVFMTNSVIGIWSVSTFTVDSEVINYTQHEITKKIQKDVRQYT